MLRGRRRLPLSEKALPPLLPSSRYANPLNFPFVPPNTVLSAGDGASSSGSNPYQNSRLYRSVTCAGGAGVPDRNVVLGLGRRLFGFPKNKDGCSCCRSSRSNRFAVESLSLLFLMLLLLLSPLCSLAGNWSRLRRGRLIVSSKLLVGLDQKFPVDDDSFSFELDDWETWLSEDGDDDEAFPMY